MKSIPKGLDKLKAALRKIVSVSKADVEQTIVEERKQKRSKSRATSD
jgi:hypothetical protein